MTAQTRMSPDPLETYLRRATFGLPAAQREDVWNELEEHILCRTEQLEFQGLPPEQALAQALREVGSPLRLSAAMNGVHNMPKMIAFGTLGMLAISAGLYALAQRPVPTMQVAMETQAPLVKCVRPNDPQPTLPVVVKTERVNCYQDESGTQEGLYVSFAEVVKAVQPLGLRAEISADGGVMSFSTNVGQRAGEGYAVFKRGGEAYMDVGELMRMVMSQKPFSVIARSYEQLSFTLGKVSTVVPEGRGEEFSQQVYRTLAQSAAHSFFDFSSQGKYFGYSFPKPADQNAEQTLHTDFKPDEVVAAYQWTDSTPARAGDGTPYLVNNIAISLGVTDAQGNVKLKIPKDAHFVASAPERNGQDVLLVRLTSTDFGNMKSGIFLPR